MTTRIEITERLFLDIKNEIDIYYIEFLTMNILGGHRLIYEQWHHYIEFDIEDDACKFMLLMTYDVH